MLNNLKSNHKDCDIVFKNINTFKDIKGWVQYLHKNKTLVFPPKFKISYKHLDFLDNIFSESYLKNYNLKNNLKELKEPYTYSRKYLDIDTLNYFDSEDSDYPSIKGIKLNKNELNENIFIDLILNYLILMNYYIFNDYIYTKIENSLVSYRKIGTIKEIIFDQFETNIILYFSQNFPCQFKGFDFYFLVKTYKNQMENNILKIKNLTTNKIKLNFSFLEFNDGIYDIENNKFMSKKNFKPLDICTTKYYNKSYN
jgi:hypothetical protein